MFTFEKRGEVKKRFHARPTPAASVRLQKTHGYAILNAGGMNMLKNIISTVADAAGKVAGAAEKLVAEILPPVEDKEQMLEKLIAERPVCYLGSVGEDGYPCVKAMLFPRGREGIKRLYFSTNTSSLRVEQFRANPKACVYFCDEKNFRGVMLQGEMEVLTDPGIKQLYWKDGDTRFYPQGVTDPDYCVLAFTAHKARYYGSLRKEEFTL